ncbi:MAG: pantoate--beta-alanine ligase [Saprospiraceae bacterium]|nr:pantoate--beta-alanine ligase [Saprospiraceae bacterium]
MKRITSVNSLHRTLNTYRKQGLTIGFVPTMGALHAGHLSLIQQAAKKNDIVVCSIFVNPTQFNNASDLAKYPRTLKKDGQLLETAGCHLLFAPSVDEIYPPGLDTEVHFSFKGLDKMMEGRFRPGHFKGMAQVVKRLLDLVQPNDLYMGQKDFQQFTIVAHMIKTLKLPIRLVVCPIMREGHGLAMSSRNERLNADLRARAAIIYKTLKAAKTKLKTMEVSEVEKWALKRMEVPDFQPEYFSIVDGHTLKPVENPELHDYVVACTAIWAGDVRLIDNMIYKNR